MKLTQFWTWDEYNIIRNKYPFEATDIAKDLPERSVRQIRDKAEQLNTFVKQPFTAEELKLAKNYGQSLGSALMFLMPNRAPVEVKELLGCVSKK